MATGRPRISYERSVEEALCFGWIDSKGSTLDDERTMLWFAPRKRGSGWSRSNKGRIERLETEGLRVAPADLARSVDAGLVLRCVFTALPLERLAAADATDDLAALEFFGRRARWCRMLVDRGNALLAGGVPRG